jgi:hypothetical protein
MYMKKNFTKILLLVILSTTISISFSNCGDGFKTLVSPEQLAHEALTMKNELYINGTPENIFFTGRDLLFVADREIREPGATYLWSYTMNGVPQGCNVMPTILRSVYRINCPAVIGELQVSLSVSSANGMIVADPVKFNLVLGPSSGLANGDVNFTIPAGTGNQPWNTVDNPIRAKVGQRIVIANADSVPHRMHTDGSPCPHGANILPNQVGYCTVNSVFSGNAYDHNTGTNSRIYIQTTAQ